MIKKILFILTALTALSLSAQVLDKHYIQGDDYFISDRALEGHSWIRVNVAKMMEAPNANTNGEAKFLVVKDGKEIWTKYFWQSRIAGPEEIKLGTVAIMFDYATGGIYIAPKQRDDARTDNWFMAKITDVSTLYKGHVLVSGGYNVSKDNIRIIGTPEVKTVEVAPAAPAVTPVQTQQSVQPEDSYVAPSSKGGLRIVKAVYGGFLPENSVDVTDYLNTLIRDGKLTVKANDQFLKVRMNSSEERSLKIKYQTVDGVFETTVIQGMQTNIPNS
ncbi:MAG: hypothetical protein RBS89_10545, partial [Candidatus Delongbacteria bacterium]|nr:hypothetical protein [Candidatus Delongbacteria bacterium]